MLQLGMTSKLSVVVNAQDEERDLPSCLASVKTLADETIVIDQSSIDNTAQIAKRAGAKVVSHERVKYVELARNFGISKAVNGWVLILDPDEEITSALSQRIKAIIKDPQADYYRIPRKNIIFGKWIKHALWWPDYQVRLFKKGKVSWPEIIHSVPMTTGIGIDLPEEEDLAILHHNYNSIDQYLEKMNRYTSIQSELLHKDGKKFEWVDLINKPFNEFVRRYFGSAGYKDGVHGLSLSLLQAFSELVIYLKLWQINKFEDKQIRLNELSELINKKDKEYQYWQNDSLYSETKNIWYKIRKKVGF